jgi:hypothetical protein
MAVFRLHCARCFRATAGIANFVETARALALLRRQPITCGPGRHHDLLVAARKSWPRPGHDQVKLGH